MFSTAKSLPPRERTKRSQRKKTSQKQEERAEIFSHARKREEFCSLSLDA